MDQLEEKGKGFLAARARSGSTEFAEKILRLLQDHGAVSSEIRLFFKLNFENWIKSFVSHLELGVWGCPFLVLGFPW